LTFADKTGKFILHRKLMEKLVEKLVDDASDEEIEKALNDYKQALESGKINKKYHKIYEIDKFKEKEKFFRHIQKDIELFEELKQKVEELRLLEEDPKAKRLIEGIKEFLEKNIKVVVFTEYVDTAKHLKELLEREFNGKVLSAIGQISKRTQEEILKNFDAQYEDAQYEDQEDKYHILITTDKLSEGINLNRAGVVINYDIPWNPVRVIQRVGRINRIGRKVYDEIFIVNFFPTEKGADIAKSREIAQTKMFMIHHVLGEDAKIFSPEEEPKPSELYKKLNTYQEEEESFFSKVKKEYEEILEKHPWIKQELEEMPRRVKVAKKGEKNELMVFIRRGKDLFVGYKDYSQSMPVEVSFEEVYEKIKASPEEKGRELSPEFWEHYQKVLSSHSFVIKRARSENSSESKAFNMVSTLLKMDELKEEKKFLNALMEDLTEYRTLPKYVLSKITSWETVLNKPEKLKERIQELKADLGEDFLEKTKARFKEESQEVIIAVENQHE
jgi:superfamily II DNA/RNA helicase